MFVELKWLETINSDSNTFWQEFQVCKNAKGMFYISQKKLILILDLKK